MVQADTYHNPIFRESLKRMFLKDGEEGFIGITSNATLEVQKIVWMQWGSMEYDFQLGSACKTLS